MAKTLWTGLNIAAATDGTQSTDFNVSGTVQIDSRKIQPGDLFIAIEGDTNDGHAFLPKVVEAGAAGSIVHKPVDDQPLVKVKNTFVALNDLAKASVSRSAAKRIAITGSVGKTGTKELMNAGFSAVGRCHATEGNLNNHYGLPLTLARMHSETEFAVLELGMSAAGEIRDLTKIAKPHVCLITKIAPAHSEFFDSIEGIAYAKAEIFEGACNGNGPAHTVLNRDDPFYDLLAETASKHGLQILSFGKHSDAHARLVSSAVVSDGGQLVEAVVQGQKLSFKLALNGEHYCLSALGVLLAANVLGQDLAAVANGMVSVQPLPGRGKISALSQRRILIDESYNASPVAMTAAFQVLAQVHDARRKSTNSVGRSVAVLGDMLELGEEGGAMHSDLADALESCQIDVLLGCGPLMAEACKKFGELTKKPVQHFCDAQTLAEHIEAHLAEGDSVLVKGSLGSSMATVCRKLLDLA